MQSEEEKSTEAKETDPAKALVEEISETDQTITIGGVEIAYKAIAGTMVLKDEKGKEKASIFYVAYLRQGVDEPGQRPLTFSFNGGPGSSSVWMHMGLLGPRRVHSGDVDELVPPPYGLVDNEFSLLDRHRPGLHRPGQHRLQPARSGRRGQAVPRLRAGHPVGRRLHSPLHHAPQALAFAQVPHRRMLRHDTRRRVCPATCRIATACTSTASC